MRRISICAGAVLCMAGSVFANVVVTDETPADPNVVVPEGEELEVRGNGLTAACTVTVGAGASVRFYSDATVAAPVTTSGAVTFRTEPGVTGTVSGKLTADGTAGTVDLVSAGLLRFSGGATLKRPIRLMGGTAEIRKSNFYATAEASLSLLSGHLTFTDGGSWSDNGSGRSVNLASASQAGDVCLEIGAGGTVSVGNNGTISVGNVATYESRLYVNGGTLSRVSPDAINLGGNGIIEVANGGDFRSARQITCTSTTGNAKVVFRNAKWTWPGNTWIREPAFFDGAGKCTLRIEGTFTFDATSCPYAAVVDVKGTNKITWDVASGSVFKLIGRGAGDTVFTFKTLPSTGLTFDLTSKKSKVVIDGADASVPYVIGWVEPCAAGTKMVATNAAPQLYVDCCYAAPGDVLHDASQVLDMSYFEGFGPASAFGGDIVLRRGTSATTYLTPNFFATTSGTVTLAEGTAIVETNPGAEKLIVAEGATLVCQDEGPLVLRNKSRSVTLGNADWANAQGEAVKWTQGAVAVIDPFDNNGRLDGIHYASKIFVGGTHDGYWDGDQSAFGSFRIGSGGIEFTAARQWAPSRGTYSYSGGAVGPRLVLMENQTWTNSAASGRSYLQLGFAYEVPKYLKAWMKAAENVTDWRIGGELEAWLYSPSNDLANVTVTVTKPATIRLEHFLDARLNARKLVLDGADMEFGRRFPKGDTLGGGDVYESVSAIDAFHLAPEAELRNGGTFTVGDRAAVTYALPRLTAVGTGNRWTGSPVSLAQTVSTIVLPAVSDELALDVDLMDVKGKTISVEGLGCLAMRISGDAGGADVAFADGGSLKLTGEGTFVGTISGAGSVEAASDGILHVPGVVGCSALSVSDGTLVLEGVGSIPAGVKVVTTGAGALQLLDPTGFDPTTMMGGTQNFKSSSDLAVTDVPRENENLTVGAGQALSVFGDGLKASSTITLEDGASIRFFRTATVAAVVTSSGSVSFAAVAGAVGSLEQPYVAAKADAQTSICVQGAGTVEFCKGADLKENNVLTIDDGNLLVSGRQLTVRKSVQMLCGSLTITNAVMDTYPLPAAQSTIAMDCANQHGDVKVTFLAGSSWHLRNNLHVRIGKVKDYESRLVLDGGTFDCSTYDPFSLCPDGTGIGVFEFRSGTFNSARRIATGGGTARFIWTGGTFRGAGVEYGWRPTYVSLTSGPITEFFIGGDCTLDLNHIRTPDLRLFSNANSKLTVGEGAKLTVVNDNLKVDNAHHLILDGCQGDGLALKLVGSAAYGPVRVDVSNATDTVEFGWTLGNEGTLTATGTSPALKVNYVVPDGFAYEQGEDYDDGWNAGFSSVTVNGLVFEEGSAYRFPVVGSTVTPLVLPGKVKLPSAMTYLVDAETRPSRIEAATLIAPAGGVEGDCTWTCGGGLSKRDSRVYAEGGVLKLDYEACGALLIVR